MTDFPFAILKSFIDQFESGRAWHPRNPKVRISHQRQGATNLPQWWIHAWATPQIPLWKVRWDSPKSQWWQWHQPGEAKKPKTVFQKFPRFLPSAFSIHMSKNISIHFAIYSSHQPISSPMAHALVPAPISLKSSPRLAHDMKIPSDEHLWCVFLRYLNHKFVRYQCFPAGLNVWSKDLQSKNWCYT